MTESKPYPAFMRTLAISVVALLAAFAAMVIAKEMGWISAELARRAVSALIGLLLVVCGNYLPKLTGAPSPDSGPLGRADRAAGRLLMVTGLGFALIWVLAPLDWARSASPLAGLGGGLLALAAWALAARRAEGGSAHLAISATGTAARLAVAMIVGSILATFGLFEIDRLWGDQAAQWSAIILVMVLVFIGATPWVRAVSRRG